MPLQKKKQSRLAKLGAKLKTPKGRIIATVLVFAVVGGGFMVYKSFAATGSYIWNKGSGLVCASQYCTESDDKSSLMIWASAGGVETKGFIKTTSTAWLEPGAKYHLCFTAISGGTGSTASVSFVNTNGGEVAYLGPVAIADTQTLTPSCADFNVSSTVAKGNYTILLNGKPGSARGAIKVSSVSLSYSGGVTPAPTDSKNPQQSGQPAPSK